MLACRIGLLPKWLTAPEDRVLLALCVLVLGYLVLGALVAKRRGRQ